MMQDKIHFYTSDDMIMVQWCIHYALCQNTYPQFIHSLFILFIICCISVELDHKQNKLHCTINRNISPKINEEGIKYLKRSNYTSFNTSELNMQD